jgi:hypothetical protein
MVTDQTLMTKGLGSRLREADLRFLVMSCAASAHPPSPELGSVSSPLGVHSSSVESDSNFTAWASCRRGKGVSSAGVQGCRVQVWTGGRVQLCTPSDLPGLTDYGLERRLRSDQKAQTNRMSSAIGRKPPRKLPKPVTLSIPVTRPSVSTTALIPKNHMPNDSQRSDTWAIS